MVRPDIPQDVRTVHDLDRNTVHRYRMHRIAAVGSEREGQVGTVFDRLGLLIAGPMLPDIHRDREHQYLENDLDRRIPGYIVQDVHAPRCGDLDVIHKDLRQSVSLGWHRRYGIGTPLQDLVLERVAVAVHRTVADDGHAYGGICGIVPLEEDLHGLVFDYIVDHIVRTVVRDDPVPSVDGQIGRPVPGLGYEDYLQTLPVLYDRRRGIGTSVLSRGDRHGVGYRLELDTDGMVGDHIVQDEHETADAGSDVDAVEDDRLQHISGVGSDLDGQAISVFHKDVTVWVYGTVSSGRYSHGVGDLLEGHCYVMVALHFPEDEFLSCNGGGYILSVQGYLGYPVTFVRDDGDRQVVTVGHRHIAAGTYGPVIPDTHRDGLGVFDLLECHRYDLVTVDIGKYQLAVGKFHLAVVHKYG